MSAFPPRSVSALISTQIGLTIVAIVTLGLYPPAKGPMALIALNGRDAGRLVQPALDHGASLIGRGPFANILIVDGQRASLVGAMLGKGVLTIAAPASWCGAQGPRA